MIWNKVIRAIACDIISGEPSQRKLCDEFLEDWRTPIAGKVECESDSDLRDDYMLTLKTESDNG